jgi:N-terminal acetyltransferase B complex non-catalytic subunit
MSSSNDAVFLRRNNQIQDAIDSQNMKQALQLIEKRMKKGENTHFLKASDPHNCLLRTQHRCDAVTCARPTNT